MQLYNKKQTIKQDDKIGVKIEYLVKINLGFWY